MKKNIQSNDVVSDETKESSGFDELNSESDPMHIDELDVNPSRMSFSSDSSYSEMELEIYSKKLEVIEGSVFPDKQSLKDAIIKKAVMEKFRIRIQYSEKNRLIVICATKGCSWRVRGNIIPEFDKWKITKFINEHSCSGLKKSNEMVTSSWIASLIKETVKARPDISPRQLKQKLKEGYGLKLPYMKVWRSRATAKKLIFGEADDSYKL
ncbi:hypothetical protein AXF42_Ash021699 [Apostasia shenzhenica]|uniref:Transposase MuDR plant domain-containing protein n=1 Tax=Apostasia shenzhenica TaxID=1088818 RepID=A0A2H9ZY89_9ASPA|nr:hypothetical protein AXF42_Ash021699 [Apostasia shenzhenica]